MYIKKLSLNNFRNIKSLSIAPGKHLNFITGHNGSGKTSILEAIFVLSNLKSFKVNSLNSIMQNDQEPTTIYAKVEDEFENLNDLGLKITSKQKELYLNGEVAKKGIASLAELLAIQVISPDVLQLLTEGPEFRRRFLYWGVYYTYPSFIKDWRKFNEAHKSKNALLKQAQAYEQNNRPIPEELLNQCKVWGKVLAQAAKTIDALNREYMENLLPELNAVLQDFLPELKIEIKYYSGWPQDVDLEEYYQQNLQHEIEAGRVSSGLHRADLRIKCFGENVSNTLSRGQLKLLACAMKIAQGDLLRKQRQNKCIYLVDDLAAELDEGKQLIFASKLIKDNNQIFMTYIDNRVLNIFNNLVSQWHEFSLQKGKIIHQYVNGEEITSQEFSLDDYI
ncbi:DNA replication/repair protein RecF [Psittacicella melopsittaci]|uniref:DNA replication and repair protein RecF n=1 Tax=Psittacicella melopsittaci TaxID=2028576 RepID=A0A3A1Y6W3_9GAMM|nr:DNA replication/repair protein RecF [Psittacicella melopsittaci]RIY31857.1 DNA replication/repair protein RecF [Psittacicella melopsittaci]